MEYVFVGGCQRSGTTAMADYLNQHPNVVIGLERFKFTADEIDEASFAPERFLAPRREETNFVDPVHFEAARAKIESGSVTHIGDKVPRYALRMNYLDKAFPSPRFVILVRDPLAVAASFEKRASNEQDSWPKKNDHVGAATHWNISLRRLREFVPKRPDHVLVVPYDRFYAGDNDWETALLSFLGLEATVETKRAYAALTAGWAARAGRPSGLTESQQGAVKPLIDWDAYTWSLATAETQLQRWTNPT